MSLAFYQEQRYDLKGQDEVEFLRTLGHTDKEIFETLIPIRKKGRRRWCNRTSAKKSYERSRLENKEQFRLRSAAQRAKISGMDSDEKEYRQRKKRAQQQAWRERNREKLALKASLRRANNNIWILQPVRYNDKAMHIFLPINPLFSRANLCVDLQDDAMAINDYDPESPLPPSDPPSPSSDDLLFNVTPLQPRFSPKLPRNWRDFRTAHQYKPARALFRQWISPQTARISTVEPGPPIKASKSRKVPIVYSFQQNEYREPDHTEATRFMAIVKDYVLRDGSRKKGHENDEPPDASHATNTTTSSPTSFVSMAQTETLDTASIHPSPHQLAKRSSEKRIPARAQAKTANDSTTIPPSQGTALGQANKRDSARANARNYYKRNRVRLLAKAAEYRQKKRVQLSMCSDEERETHLEERRRRQRIFMHGKKPTSKKKGKGPTSELSEAREKRRLLRIQRTKTSNRAIELKEGIGELSTSQGPTTAQTKLLEELQKKESDVSRLQKDIDELTSKITRLEDGAESNGHNSVLLSTFSTSPTPASSLKTSQIDPISKRGLPAAEDSDVVSKRRRTTSRNEAPTPLESMQYEDSPSLRLPDDVATVTYPSNVSMIGTTDGDQYNGYNFVDPQTRYQPQFFEYGPDDLPTRGLASLAWSDELSPSTLSRASSNVADPAQALSFGYQLDSRIHPAYIADGDSAGYNYLPPHTGFVDAKQPSFGSESSGIGCSGISPPLNLSSGLVPVGASFSGYEMAPSRASQSSAERYVAFGTSYLGYEMAPTSRAASQSSAESHVAFGTSYLGYEIASTPRGSAENDIAFGPVAPSMPFDPDHHKSEAVLPANILSQPAFTTQDDILQPGAGPLYSIKHDHFPAADKRQDACQESAIVDKALGADSNSAVIGQKLTLEEVKERLKVFEDHPQYPWLNDPSDSWSMAIDLGVSKKGEPQGLPTTVSGIPLRTLMEQLLRSPDVKANPDGSLPLSLLLERGMEYWEKAVRLDKKADEKLYIQKPGQSDRAYNTEMTVAVHETCKAAIRAGGNPAEFTFGYKLREWVRKDARYGRMAGLLSVEFALLALTTSNGLLKCIYHHHSGKDFSKQDQNAVDNYNKILDKRAAVQKEREAILAFVTGQQGVDNINGGNSMDGGEDGEGEDEGEDEEEEGKKDEKEIKLPKIPALPTSLITGTPEQALRPRKDKKDAEAQANADSEKQLTKKTKKKGGGGQQKSSDNAQTQLQLTRRKKGYGDCGCRMEDLLSGFLLWKSQSVYSPTLGYRETYATNQLQPLPRTFLLDALDCHLGQKLTECFGYVLVEKKSETRYGESEWIYVENRPEWILTKAIDRLTMTRDEIVAARREKEQTQRLLDEAEDDQPLN
ncbi:hypothetical protein VNI00_006777 [Paramarasmius palmivorus]|uniref:BZIP domain-containing protein n=1 Tax=Paramarasmius palmivorus TaxID=297713 RepID=A0AAW0D7J2_9AGAR